MPDSSKQRRRVAAAIFLAASALLTGAVVFEGGPDPVIFPRQQIPIFFPHDYHVRASNEATGVKGEGLDCEFCHENVSESSKSSDLDIPGHDACDSCHGEWIGEEDEPAPPKSDCARCHRDLAGESNTATVAARMIVPPPNIIFGHDAHVAAEVACKACHASVEKKTVATRDDYPTMDQCIACHEDKGVSTACKTCHLTGATGRLITEFPQGSLQPRRLHSFAIHDASFLDDHATSAKREPGYCDTCHKKDFCLTCHDGLGRDVRYHPSDFVSMHYLSAKKDDTRCQSCHRLQSFCIGCHVRSGVATLVDINAPFLVTRKTNRVRDNGRANGPHPMAEDGWINPASRNFHGFFAQRNIKACVSCHQEQQCLQCHASAFGSGSSSSIGGNPHGPNPQRLKGSTASKQSVRACLKCHHPSDSSWR